MAGTRATATARRDLVDVFSPLVEAGVSRTELITALDAAVAARRASVVYFVGRDDLVKIGTTIDLPSRLASLDRGDSAIPGMTVSPVRVMALMLGGRATERSIHATFAGLREAGEWFRFREPLVGFVNAISAASLSDPELQKLIEAARTSLLRSGNQGLWQRSLLSDVRAAFLPGESFVPWRVLAERLRAARLDTYPYLTKEQVSMHVSQMGARSKNGKYNGAVLKGVALGDVDRVIAGQVAS